ncbi:putative mitochondrial hypothetical protein [Leptomonas pyrrhocoris]|uniref:UBA domain-containing protein n=1 Tax=Leptomonas pyrrhocoris TaxID=157538 RepID=A0A0M9FZQ2_LEPPY|nr:putative mitochondrial hypothetical protein [Leptomonas pyrrhocoris]KPA79239.1 putative mitochondrial hypothetical protein [Leptomonas pyrrhocoris]|eukprot:XP_015657678.1 putative mitochondrial hypothetical protein [Leptomonas pyrrhocoris]
MVLEGAPVTGLTLIISTVSSAMVRGQYTRYRNAAFAAASPLSPHSTSTAVKRLLLQSIPIGPLGFSAFDVCLAVSLAYQFRTLERRWGSNPFLGFLLTASAFGVCATQLFVTDSGTPQLSLDAVRILSAVGTLVPLAALLTRYVREVPSLHIIMHRLPGTHLAVTEKALVLLPFLKLVLNPVTQVDAQTYRRAAVIVDVGLWTRLLCTLIGVLFAIFSTRSTALRWWLVLFTKYVCRPLLRFLRPLTEILFGASFTVDHAKPRHRQQQQQQGGGSFHFDNDGSGDAAGAASVVDDGRYVVESLAGGDALQEVRARMRARRHAMGRGGANGDGAGSASRTPVTRRSPQEEAARASAVATIEALGLPVGRDEIAAVLDMTDGNVETAVHVLMGS